MAFEHDLLCLVPITKFHCTLQIGTIASVKIHKYPILVFEATIMSWRGFAILHCCHRPALGRDSGACCTCRWQRARATGSKLRGRLRGRSENHCGCRRNWPIQQALKVLCSCDEIGVEVAYRE